MPKNFIDKLVFWIGLEGLWCYPASVLGTFFEGQSAHAIFSTHYFSVVIFIFLSITSFVYLFKHENFKVDKKICWVIVPLVLSLFLNFYQLDKPNLNGDEYDLGYQAYNMVDGIYAGRKAYTLSFSAHPPLALDISHISMQLLNNRGIDNLEDWQYRLAPALLGSLTVAVFFLLIFKLKNNLWLALVCSILLATNSYHIFLSRIFQREAFLTFYLVIFLYFLLVRSYFLASFFLGGAFLVKATAVIFLPLLLIGQKINFKKFTPFILLTIPIVIYNFGAYLTTGYTDIFFSRIFRTSTHPGASIMTFHAYNNFVDIVKLLCDQFSSVTFFIGIIAIFYTFIYKRREHAAKLFLCFAAVSLIFFFFNGVKVYYLSFLAIPWSYFIGAMIFDLKKKGIFLFLIVLMFSLNYVYNTFYSGNFLTSVKYTEIIPETSFKNHSLTTQGFLEERGWKRVVDKLNAEYKAGDCLLFEPEKFPLQIRRYLGLNDKIKEFYLGKDYFRKYQICEPRFTYSKIWQINMNEFEVSL